jgi:hypothetical protein
LIPEIAPQDAEDESFPHRYLADLVFNPLNEQRPLWEVHALRMKCKDVSACFIFRVHHSLGDGISLLSYVLARCQRVDKPDLPIVLSNPIKFPDAPAHKFRVIVYLLILWTVMIFAWHTFVDVIYFTLRILGLEDSKMPVKGNAGVELWPKKLATAVFSIDDMRAVKDAVNVTINDVLLSILQSGFRRYLEMKCPELSKKGLIEKLRLSGISMVNTRMAREAQELSKMLKGDPNARWGNDMGYVLIPLCLKKFKDPLDSVRNAKVLSDRKKTSLEAYFSYKITSLVMKLLGAKVAANLHYRALSNTTFTLSNVRGPSEEIMFAGNPISSLTATVSGLPQAITLHMISYMGIAKFQIMVAKDVIPDPEVLAQCFEDSLKELKDAIPKAAAVSGSR